MRNGWTVTAGRAPRPELRDARNAAVVAFYGATKSFLATARAFNLDRKFVGSIVRSRADDTPKPE